MPTREEIAQYIWSRAPAYNVNRGTALGIARGEGLVNKTLNSPYFGNKDADGYSYGPFQLFSRSSDSSVIQKGGLAYEFMQKYGEAPSAANWKQQVDFSLDYMGKNGTGAWYSVRDAGGVANITQKGNNLARQMGLSDNVDKVGASSAVSAENANNPWNPGNIGTPGVGAVSISGNLVEATDTQTVQQAQSAAQQADAIIAAAAQQASTEATVQKATLDTQQGWLDWISTGLGDYFQRGFIIALGLVFVAGAIALIVWKGKDALPSMKDAAVAAAV